MNAVKELQGLIERLNIYEGRFTNTLVTEGLDNRRVVFHAGGGIAIPGFRVQEAWCGPNDDDVATNDALRSIVNEMRKIIQIQIKSLSGREQKRTLRVEMPAEMGLSGQPTTVGKIRAIVQQCQVICDVLGNPNFAPLSPSNPMNLSLTSPSRHCVYEIPGFVPEE